MMQSLRVKKAYLISSAESSDHQLCETIYLKGQWSNMCVVCLLGAWYNIIYNNNVIL